MKIVGFFYSWNQQRKLDAYQQSIVDALTRRGIEIHILFGNYLVENEVLYGFSKRMSEDKVIRYIREVSPDLILSMNHAGITRRIQDEAGCPVVSWLVDDFVHIFLPDGREATSQIFGDRTSVVIPSSQILADLKKRFPDAIRKFHFLSSVTDPDEFRKVKLPQKYNISFVGSFLDSNDFEKVLRTLHRDGKSSDRKSVV